MPNIDTLVTDMYNVFDKLHGGQEDLFKLFGDGLNDTMRVRLTEQRKNGYLRLSNIGKPDRQLWYAINDPDGDEKLPPQAHIKFMYGDMQEHLCIMLAKLAGHEVTDEQKEVVVNGIPGHIDGRIDGHVVDVKSASRFAFSKFSQGTLLEPGNDAFGYIGQLAAYVHAVTPGKDGYILAVNKDLGHLALLKIDAEILAKYNIEARIDYAKDMVNGQIPDRCYPDVPDGKSGNMKLDTGCSYCSRKFNCWDDLKTYYYSNGPRYLTKVVKEPKVQSEFPVDLQE